jgi:hypothetical protein
MATFSQIWNKKSQDLRSGTGLEQIWKIQIFGYMDIYAKKAISEYTQYRDNYCMELREMGQFNTNQCNQLF